MNKIIRTIKHPGKILLKLDNLNLIRLSDKFFIKLRFKIIMGYKLNLSEPKTFNEKLNWLKLYDRRDIYIQ